MLCGTVMNVVKFMRESVSVLSWMCIVGVDDASYLYTGREHDSGRLIADFAMPMLRDSEE